MSYILNSITHCYVDESIHDSIGMVVTAFVFASSDFENAVTEALREVGLNPPQDEFKSSGRMDTDDKMRAARRRLISMAGSRTKIAVFFGPFHRPHLGRQALQALQSVLVRNAIPASSLWVHFDKGIFSSAAEAVRLCKLFHSLTGSKVAAEEFLAFVLEYRSQMP